MSKTKRIRRKVGDIVSISLGDGTYSYGRVLKEPMIAFYKLRGSEPHNLEAILAAPVAFVLFVMNYAVTKGIWPVIGNAPLTPDLLQERFFSKKDPISGELTTYRAGTGEEFPATQEECDKLERCAVWDPEHVVDRLQDYYAGRPNDWVESLRV